MVPHSQVPQQLGAIFLFAEIFSVLSLQLESSIPGCMLTEHQHTAAMQAPSEKVASVFWQEPTIQLHAAAYITQHKYKYTNANTNTQKQVMPGSSW